MVVKNRNIDKSQSKEDDFKAVRKVLNGDSSAYGYLQDKYTRIIAALIRRMVKNEDDIDDLVQETFIKAYRALNTFQFGYSFSAWIYRIASNNCIDFLRKKRFSMISLSKPISGEDDTLFFEIKDTSYVPDIEVINAEKKKALWEAIMELPDNYREIIQLRHEEELDYNEISNKLGLPLGTVKAHLFRARKILYSSLKKQRHLFTDY